MAPATPLCPLLGVLVLVLVLAGVQPDDLAQLPLCTPRQACAAEVRRFPLRSETVGEMVEELGSGQGSGEPTATEPMLYDEFVTSVTPYDFDAEPDDVESKRLCRCEDGEDDQNQKCSTESVDHTIQIDPRLRLGFCQPLAELVHAKCVGHRHNLQVIGHFDPTGEYIADVKDTHVGCTCNNGYSLVRAEPWTEGYVMLFKCAHN